MNYSKLLPTVLLALSLANGLAQAETQPTGNTLFQMSEVSSTGLTVAAKDADTKCGAGSCGSAKASEKKTAADSKCASKKAADSKCAGKKATDSKCAAKKSAASKCAAAKCAAKH